MCSVTTERRLLVTMHYPLEMHCVAMILKAVSDLYPQAVVSENGEVWDRMDDTPYCIDGHPEYVAGCSECDYKAGVR